MHLLRSLGLKREVGAGGEADKERPQRTEGEEDFEDNLRRFLAASLLQRETRFNKTPLASFAKAWGKRRRKEDEKTPAMAKVGVNPSRP
jgi:hypothetical protein